MKRFHDFIKENKEEEKISFNDYLKKIKESLMKDFERTEKQALQFELQYKDLLKIAYENNYTVREAIASTKRPGILFGQDVVEESFIFDIDDKFEEYYNNIVNEKNINNIQSIVNDYFTRFNEKYSDKRIFERVKNNYKRLKELANKKEKEING